MYDAIMLACAVIGAIAAILMLLPLLFGVDLRIRRRSDMSTEIASPERRREKRLWAAVVLAVLSVLLSAASFYRLQRPRIVEKIVEKPVDRIVEKLVPQECPQPKIAKNGKANKPSEPTPAQNAPQLSIGRDNSGFANNGPNYGTQSIVSLPEAKITASLAQCSEVNDRYKCVVSFRPDIELTSNIAFTLAFDNSLDQSPTVGIDGIPPPVVEVGLQTGLHSLYPNNIVQFTVVVPSTVSSNTEISVTVYATVPVKLMAWKRGV